MLITRFRQIKNKKGITLVEMLAAVTITAILAIVLSMLIVPVMNTYNVSAVRVELAQAATSRLNDMAKHLRGAEGIYLSTAKRNVSKTWYNGKNNYFNDSSTGKFPKEDNYVFPEIRWENYSNPPGSNTTRDTRACIFDGVITTRARYSFVMDNYYERKESVKGYLYPELVIADYSDMSKRFLDYAGGFGIKLESDDYQTRDIVCPDVESMFFYVRQNPDNGNSPTVLEMHLIVKKGKITYEGTKTIVCENLVIRKDKIYTTDFTHWNGNVLTKQNVTVSTGTDPKKWTKYYTVWFAKERN